MVADRFKKKKKGVIRRFFGFMFYTKQFGRFKENFGTPWTRLASQVQSLLKFDNLEGPKETFSNAISRLALDEKQIISIQNGYLRNAIFMFFLGIFFGIAGIYLITDGLVAAGLVTQLFTFLSFICALYMHFWFFQIKNKKLGCSFKEWWENKIIANDAN